MIHVMPPDTIDFPEFLSPCAQQRLLNELLGPPMTAAEEMLGELPAGVQPANGGRHAGPAERQVFWEDQETDQDD
jgi:hypothetical protein